MLNIPPFYISVFECSVVAYEFGMGMIHKERGV